MRRALALLAATSLCLAAACTKTPIGPEKGTETKEATQPMLPPQTPPPGLPVEPGSRSEVLSATHLFTVEVEAVTATPWAVAPSGLEQRSLTLRLRLLDVLKGALREKKGEVFEAVVGQERESELVESDYHGLWSHTSPEPKKRYLVVAESAESRGAALVQDGPTKRLLAGELAGDVRFAQEGESLYQEQLREAGGTTGELAAARALLDHADASRGLARDVFARYVWARVAPVFLGSKDRPLVELLDLVTADDATLPLRAELCDGLYEATLALEPNPELSRKVVRALLTVLLEDEAKPLRHRLVNAQLHSLVLDPEGRPKVSAEDAVKSPGDRAKLGAILAELRTPRATALGAWLATAR